MKGLRKPRPRNQALCRRLAFARDKGKCADCGTDTDTLEGLIGAQAAFLQPEDWVEWRAAFLGDLGFPINGKSLWEVDHIVPVALGGKDEAANLVTKCVRCHRIKTDSQAAMLAKARRLGGNRPLKPRMK